MSENKPIYVGSVPEALDKVSSGVFRHGMGIWGLPTDFDAWDMGAQEGSGLSLACAKQIIERPIYFSFADSRAVGSIVGDVLLNGSLVRWKVDLAISRSDFRKCAIVSSREMTGDDVPALIGQGLFVIAKPWKCVIARMSDLR
jgi:hypothetical protein